MITAAERLGKKFRLSRRTKVSEKGHKEEGLHRSNKLDLANYCRLRASIVAALASSAIEASKRKLPKHYSLLIWDA